MTEITSEPPTSGKVVLETNYGEIEIDLWTQETPRACRNFIQLCLEGYYDRTVFHRVIKDFMVQGGDPTGTGTGGESIYGQPFLDEFHSRLRFSHRGIVAMANDGSRNKNESQFFMTVDACPWLDRKHTIFGKIQGETIFNLIKMSEVQTDTKNGDRPICDPMPQILKALVIDNPFEDIVPRALKTVQKQEEKSQEQTKNIPSFKARKKTKVLSFANDDDSDEDKVPQKPRVKKAGIKSQHDSLAEKMGIKPKEIISEQQLEQLRKKKEAAESAKENLTKKLKNIHDRKPEDGEANNIENLAGQLMQQSSNKGMSKQALEQELQKLQRTGRKRSRSRSMSPTSRALARAQLKTMDRESQKSNQNSDDEHDQPSGKHRSQKVDEEKLKQARQEYESLRAGLMTFKKDKLGTNLDETNIDIQAKHSALQIQRQKFLNSMKNTKHRENETMAKFNDFVDKIKTKQSRKETGGWMAQQVKFHVSSDQAYNVDKAITYGQTVGTGKNYEDFITQGDPLKQLQYQREREGRSGFNK